MQCMQLWWLCSFLISDFLFGCVSQKKNKRQGGKQDEGGRKAHTRCHLNITPEIQPRIIWFFIDWGNSGDSDDGGDHHYYRDWEDSNQDRLKTQGDADMPKH